MKRRTKAEVGTAIALVSAFFVLAPIVYSPTVVYGPLVFYNSPPNQPSYPNWNSLSCTAFGFGMYYGRTVFQYNDSYQLGCASPSASLP
jgi:hypothetical protein